ncbi:MAG: DUF5681 domain-containing protein [Pseudomonadota bacterium]
MAERSNVRRIGPQPDAEELPYEVGYGKPPVESRFKPGQSGNPRGRPKGSKNTIDSTSAKNHERLKQVIVDEAYRQITIRDGDRIVTMPVIQAVVRNMALNAAKGDKRSQRMLTDLLKTIEGERKALADEYVKTMIEYKVEWEQRLEERERHGLTGPKPYPHPDDIIVNFATSEVEIRGPMSKEEDDYMDKYLLKADVERQIADLEKKSSGKPKSKATQGRLTGLRSLSDRIEAHLASHPGSGRFTP